MSIAGFEGLQLPDLSIRVGLDRLPTRRTLLDEDCQLHPPRGCIWRVSRTEDGRNGAVMRRARFNQPMTYPT